MDTSNRSVYRLISELSNLRNKYDKQPKYSSIPRGEERRKKSREKEIMEGKIMIKSTYSTKAHRVQACAELAERPDRKNLRKEAQDSIPSFFYTGHYESGSKV